MSQDGKPKNLVKLSYDKVKDIADGKLREIMCRGLVAGDLYIQATGCEGSLIVRVKVKRSRIFKACKDGRGKWITPTDADHNAPCSKLLHLR